MDDEKRKRTYWYADFEADPTSENHTPYFCYVEGLTTTNGFTSLEYKSFR